MEALTLRLDIIALVEDSSSNYKIIIHLDLILIARYKYTNLNLVIRKRFFPTERLYERERIRGQPVIISLSYINYTRIPCHALHSNLSEGKTRRI